ncbi:hypothetical protein [Rhizomonospora bruguierae]|uniref:hypothetical protein n=1 Tax=Rhizomonospora bruguierae TaxID=1581705 RepID=UPI001BCBCF2B|nr:hypothetical protein [Micromonospora sp. NBRC 107566]
MADRPDWVSDQPVEVDIQSLYSFAQAIQQELDQNVKPNVPILMERIGTGGEGMSFGRDGRYSQGQVIGSYHQDCEIKARELLENLQIGLQAITYAAQSIAQEYTSQDEQNAMEISKIGGYFSPKDKSRSMAEQLGLPEPEPDDPPLGGPGRNRAI